MTMRHKLVYTTITFTEDMRREHLNIMRETVVPTISPPNRNQGRIGKIHESTSGVTFNPNKPPMMFICHFHCNDKTHNLYFKNRTATKIGGKPPKKAPD